LEGLPINQYKEVEVTIGPSTTETKRLDTDEWEPPMPRDSHLLPEHSQQILRAARSGRLYKPPAPPEEDKDGPEEEDEHKEVPKGFTVKKWVKVPRHLEDAEPEYLAKRRKGLPSHYVANGQVAQPAALRETKVKKTDAEGNVSVYKVLVPEGQAVEGEVQATDAIVEAAPVAAAPGTIVEGVGVVNAEGVVVANDILQQTPPRRRPPPPKKKKRHGPGKSFSPKVHRSKVPLRQVQRVACSLHLVSSRKGLSSHPKAEILRCRMQETKMRARVKKARKMRIKKRALIRLLLVSVCRPPTLRLRRRAPQRMHTWRGQAPSKLKLCPSLPRPSQ
jgi:hypothetical protein